MPQNSVIFCLLLVLLGAALVYALFQPGIKGWAGEKKVASVLFSLDRSKYKVINNVVLSIRGKTAQIDHLVISDYGVFVIETKNYKGWITGGENSEYWTQVLYRNRYQFYNPVRQNNGHIQALKNCLYEFPGIRYISIIVFCSGAEIKVNSAIPVIHPFKLTEVIRNYSDATLTEAEKTTIFVKLNSLNLKDQYDKKQHVQSIKQVIKKRDELIKQNKCPQCGGDLVMRSGKFGKFLGCSSFPQCRFIRNI